MWSFLETCRGFACLMMIWISELLMILPITSLNLNNYVVEISWVRFGTRTIRVSNDFLTPTERFEPRVPFFNMSKYEDFPVFFKKFKFLSSQIFLIFDSKHGSPKNYSDLVFFFFFFSIEGYAFSRSQLLKDIEQSEQIFADLLRGEYSCSLHFLGYFGPEVLALGGLKHETF